MVYFRLFVFVLLFPVVVQAQHKFQLELVSPRGPFEMKVGDPLTVEFKATTSRGDFHYGIFLKHADEPPWENDEGPLTLKPVKLKQGKNTFQWDGKSFAWAPDDVPKMGTLKAGVAGQYYFKIMIFDSGDVQLLGMLNNAHRKTITHLRSKNFSIKK